MTFNAIGGTTELRLLIDKRSLSKRQTDRSLWSSGPRSDNAKIAFKKPANHANSEILYSCFIWPFQWRLMLKEYFKFITCCLCSDRALWATSWEYCIDSMVMTLLLALFQFGEVKKSYCESQGSKTSLFKINNCYICQKNIQHKWHHWKRISYGIRDVPPLGDWYREVPMCTFNRNSWSH